MRDGTKKKRERNIYFDHGAVDRHLDNVEGVIVPATVIVKADLPCQSLDFHLKVKRESKSQVVERCNCMRRSFIGRCLRKHWVKKGMNIEDGDSVIRVLDIF